MRLDILHKHEVISQCIQVTGVTLEAKVSPLGKGGFSKVYKGFHNGEAVAIKKLKGDSVKMRHPGDDTTLLRVCLNSVYHLVTDSYEECSHCTTKASSGGI